MIWKLHEVVAVVEVVEIGIEGAEEVEVDITMVMIGGGMIPSIHVLRTMDNNLGEMTEDTQVEEVTHISNHPIPPGQAISRNHRHNNTQDTEVMEEAVGTVAVDMGRIAEVLLPGVVLLLITHTAHMEATKGRGQVVEEVMAAIAMEAVMEAIQADRAPITDMDIITTEDGVVLRTILRHEEEAEVQDGDNIMFVT